MNSIVEIATAGEKLGILGFLIAAIVALVWVICNVYKDRRACEEGRLEDAKERNNMNRELGVFKGKLEMLERVHVESLVTMRGTHGS
jgi:hypothetical protein